MPPEEQSVPEQPDIEDEIDEIDEFDEDAIEEAQMPQYAFKANRKRKSEDKFEREIQQIDELRNSNSNDGSDGFFKQSPNKFSQERLNFNQPKGKNQKLNHRNDDEFDNIEMQEEEKIIQPQKLAQPIKDVQEVHLNKDAEVIDENRDELANKKKANKKKKK